MSGASKIAQGLLWLVSGRLAGAALSVASTAVIARLLTPADFGVVAAAMVVLSLANVVFDGAFGVNLMRKKVLRLEDIRTTLTTGLLLSFLIVATVVYVAPGVERFFGIPHVGLVLAASSVTIPFKAVFAIAIAKLQRERKFKAIAGTSLFGQFAGYILVGIPLSLLGAKVWALVGALVVAGAAEAGMAAVLARLSFRPAWDLDALRDVRGTSFYSVANVMNWAANVGANAIIGRTMGAGDLGYYSRGWKLLDLLVAATATPLSKVLLPKFSQLHGERERLENALLNALGIVLPTYAVASVLLTLQAPLIVAISLGHQWDATIPVVQVLFATLLPRCGYKVSENFAVAIGKSAAAAVRQGIYAAMMVAGAIAGSSYGIVGVAVGISAAITIFYTISMAYVVSAGKVSGWAVIMVHLKAALLAVCVMLVDGIVLELLGPLSMWAKQLIAGTSGAVAVLGLILAAPRFFLGEANVGSLLQMLDALRSSWSLRGGRWRIGLG